MSRKSGSNRAVNIPVAEGLTLDRYGRDESGAERFSLWSRSQARAVGGLALSRESGDTSRIDYSPGYPEAHIELLVKALPALAAHAFSQRPKSLRRLVTRMDTAAENYSDAYRQAVTAAGFRLARIDHASTILTHELLRDSLDNTGLPVSGVRRPPVQVDVRANKKRSELYLNLPNLPPGVN